MKVIKSISLDKETWEILKKISIEENRNMSNMIETLIQKYKKNEKKDDNDV